MIHTICTDAGRITIKPALQQGHQAVAVTVTNLPGLPWPILPTLHITPEHAQLLAQAFELAAEEAMHLADNAARHRPEPLQVLQGGKGAGS